MSGRFWKVGKDEDSFPRVKAIYIEAPFKNKHDVRLYVDGDFKSDRQRMIYANRIAKILNGTQDW